jgi:signal transduction histidine kinase
LKRISRIVRSLKEFSHPGGSDVGAADLNRAIETTLAVSRHEWKYVAEAETDLDPDLPLVRCVIDEINQAVLNLVVNAAHAVEDANAKLGRERGLITVRTRKCGEYAVIEVQDTGTGIPAKVRGSLFDPFFTTKDVGRGTGQGLAIAQAVVVQNHQGRIEFDTVEGEGTTFRLMLPLPVESAAAEVA